MNIDIENYIEGRYRHLINKHPALFTDEYDYLYKGFGNSRLIELLSAIHSGIVNSFEQMNLFLPTSQSAGYFHADDSRLFIDLIVEINALVETLPDLGLRISLDEYYSEVLKDCSSWLQYYYGSSIPPDTDSVIVYYKKPLFYYDSGSSLLQPSIELEKNAVFIGEGGFGEVYRYTHPLLDIDFAVKVFKPVFRSKEHEEDERRFLREAKMLFKLNHDNIVQIYDVGRVDGNLYIREEYIDGETLSSFRDKHGNLTFRSAGKAVIQILKGLEHAHSKGIIHRDLKPSNVMVEKDGERYKCKIIDFGVSAFMDSEAYTKLTKTGEIVAGGPFADPILTQKPEEWD